jgi:hypothetical protein
MLKLQGLSLQNPQVMKFTTDINDEVFLIARDILDAKGMVVFEETLIRAGHRKNRQFVQWKAIKDELEAYFGKVLIRLSRTFLREQIAAKIDPLKVLVDVAANLRKGYGSETAGYCFSAKYEDLTRRQIEQRQHIAAGFERSAGRLQGDLDIALPPPSAAGKPEDV